MARVDLVVGIGAEYKGKPAFNKANKDVLGLQAGVKTLAKAYVGLAGAQKAFRYASQSLKAFAEDDLAAQKLTRTVENLGLAYESTNVENFVQGLERTFHVADEPLVPDEPDVPDVPPLNPLAPLPPFEPEVPDVPDEPLVPEEPFAPETPDEPAVPERPEPPT